MPRILPILGILFFSCHYVPTYPPGGYDYPKHPPAADSGFYFLQLREKITKRDALNTWWYYRFYSVIGEPNLSIAPQPDPVYRLTWQPSFHSPITISLTQKKIIVKITNATDEYFYTPDTNRLTRLESRHLAILIRHYPLDDAIRKWPQRKKYYLDSMIRLYPQLLREDYYQSLLAKGFARSTPLLSYTQKVISLSQNTFDSLTTQVNTSGFWSLVYPQNCDYMNTDGDGCILEINTPGKYQVLNFSDCSADSTLPARRAWQALIDRAGMGDRIHLIRDTSKYASPRKPIVTDTFQIEERHKSKGK